MHLILHKCILRLLKSGIDVHELSLTLMSDAILEYQFETVYYVQGLPMP